MTTAALLAHSGHDVTVLEGQVYPGGCAGTFYHQGYRFDAGATVVGGFQANGPHALIAHRLGIEWPVVRHDPAWVVHLPDCEIALMADNADVIHHFPQTESFWREQSALADLGWSLTAQGLSWPPTSTAEWTHLLRVGLSNLPRDLRLTPYALVSVAQWLKWRGLSKDAAFTRFIDAQLLISAQTTSQSANAAYSATALDLARQGVFHVKGGIGGIATALVDKITEFGGRVLYHQHVEHIDVQDGRAVAVETRHNCRSEVLPCDFLIANLTPWSLDNLLADKSPASLRREVQTLRFGWGAFALHLGLRADALPANFPDHHQIITSLYGTLGETRSIFISLSPLWDTTRAPEGHRAATVTTHTNVQQWWDLADEAAYEARKVEYTDAILSNIERVIPGFRAGITLTLPGTPITYQFYTGRYRGMVGGFPQTSLLRARSPLTGIANVRLVGDSIFPGQSTAGVTLGAMRVAADVERRFASPTQKRSRSRNTQEAIHS